jgi:nicotinamide-nucleotide amidase
MTIATAESCTGGNIAALLAKHPGSSEFFTGSVVAYCNKIKHNVLGVSEETLNLQGAVSQETVEQMAKGVIELMKTDIGIAVSGIAGPTGGSETKPVGTVWMAVATPDGTKAVLRNAGTDRSQIISRASAYAIEMLYDELKKR